jgi:PilZ domain-containing protein
MIDLVDKRLHPRYPITLELQYKAMKRDGVQHLGDGMTLNISSGGVLFHVNGVFENKDILPDGGMIELAIKWPLLLDEVCPLKLVVRGCIVRRDDTRLAVKTEQHEFRTAGVIARNAV